MSVIKEQIPIHKKWLWIKSNIPFTIETNYNDSIEKTAGTWRINTYELLPEKYHKNNPVFMLYLKYENSPVGVVNPYLHYSLTDIELSAIDSGDDSFKPSDLNDTNNLINEVSSKVVHLENALGGVIGSGTNGLLEQTKQIEAANNQIIGQNLPSILTNINTQNSKIDTINNNLEGVNDLLDDIYDRNYDIETHIEDVKTSVDLVNTSVNSVNGTIDSVNNSVISVRTAVYSINNDVRKNFYNNERFIKTSTPNLNTNKGNFVNDLPGFKQELLDFISRKYNNISFEDSAHSFDFILNSLVYDDGNFNTFYVGKNKAVKVNSNGTVTVEDLKYWRFYIFTDINSGVLSIEYHFVYVDNNGMTDITVNYEQAEQLIFDIE